MSECALCDEYIAPLEPKYGGHCLHCELALVNDQLTATQVYAGQLKKFLEEKVPMWKGRFELWREGYVRGLMRDKDE